MEKADFHSVKKELMSIQFNQEEPIIELVNVRYGHLGESSHSGRSLYLRHRHEAADLKLDEMNGILKVIYKIW